MTIGVKPQPAKKNPLYIYIQNPTRSNVPLGKAVALWNTAFENIDVNITLSVRKNMPLTGGYLIDWESSWGSKGQVSDALKTQVNTIGSDATKRGTYGLSDGCKVATACHEIGHAMGLWHEQWNPSVDIEYLKQLVKAGKYVPDYEFQNYTDRGDDFNVYHGEIDMASVMLYGSYGDDIDQNNGPSRWDALTVANIFRHGDIKPVDVAGHPVLKSSKRFILNMLLPKLKKSKGAKFFESPV